MEEKKKSDSEFLSYNLMLNSGKKICASHDKKNKYSNSRVVRNFFLNETKNHNLPCKLNGRSLSIVSYYNLFNNSPVVFSIFEFLSLLFF